MFFDFVVQEGISATNSLLISLIPIGMMLGVATWEFRKIRNAPVDSNGNVEKGNFKPSLFRILFALFVGIVIGFFAHKAIDNPTSNSDFVAMTEAETGILLTSFPDDDNSFVCKNESISGDIVEWTDKSKSDGASFLVLQDKNGRCWVEILDIIPVKKTDLQKQGLYPLNGTKGEKAGIGDLQ